jgi:hypothetical protein
MRFPKTAVLNRAQKCMCAPARGEARQFKMKVLRSSGRSGACGITTEMQPCSSGRTVLRSPGAAPRSGARPLEASR